MIFGEPYLLKPSNIRSFECYTRHHPCIRAQPRAGHRSTQDLLNNEILISQSALPIKECKRTLPELPNGSANAVFSEKLQSVMKELQARVEYDVLHVSTCVNVVVSAFLRQ